MGDEVEKQEPERPNTSKLREVLETFEKEKKSEGDKKIKE